MERNSWVPSERAGALSTDAAKRGRRLKGLALFLLLFMTFAQGCKSQGTGSPGGNVNDRAIVAGIRTLISEDPALNAPSIRVFALEGKVTLSGPVPDSRAKGRLLAGARAVEGVKSVSDNLELPAPP